ncbi:hypothetical protein GQ43DRAFT_297124 [Delitschia confertaspora ATCC 74209]|uniref:Uncharacterized protein n=1 Tax=Delitschia confertaspora ATCC 74209 TaxID=1513339 RepID=A0A9P4JR35_9PLEO|nr:hypothetical protein GQ43DRAFT_297124 [Delitschia confertaspora ATCC 74209]
MSSLPSFKQVYHVNVVKESFPNVRETLPQGPQILEVCLREAIPTLLNALVVSGRYPNATDDFFNPDLQTIGFQKRVMSLDGHPDCMLSFWRTENIITIGHFRILDPFISRAQNPKILLKWEYLVRIRAGQTYDGVKFRGSWEAEFAEPIAYSTDRLSEFEGYRHPGPSLDSLLQNEQNLARLFFTSAQHHATELWDGWSPVQTSGPRVPSMSVDTMADSSGRETVDPSIKSEPISSPPMQDLPEIPQWSEGMDLDSQQHSSEVNSPDPDSAMESVEEVRRSLDVASISDNNAPSPTEAGPSSGGGANTRDTEEVLGGIGSQLDSSLSTLLDQERRHLTTPRDEQL